MFNERDTDEYHKKERTEDQYPFLVNLHSGSSKQPPYDWIISNGRNKAPFEIRNKVNFFFCAKHENSGKIESHLWFFKGFCAYTNPTYCQMIDAGTIPMGDSISKIVKFMDVYKRVGGACGEIEVFEPNDKELGYGYNIERDQRSIAVLEAGKKVKGKKHFKAGDKWYSVERRNV